MAAGGVVLLHGAGEADRALLNQIQQVQPLALIALGQIHHQAQVGRDHLLLGPLAGAQGAPLEIVVLAGRTTAAGDAATFLQGHHRLHLSPQGELLLRGEELVATDLTEKCTQRTRHGPLHTCKNLGFFSQI